MVRPIATLICLVFLAFFSLTGCAPPAGTKPDMPSTVSPERPGTGKSVTLPRESTPPSSLDALRRGEKAAVGPLKEIYFDFDRYDLRPDARATLKSNSDWLKANPSARVQIEGHADERGTNEYNLALGAKRAESTKDYLTALGIPKNRLSTISYGEELLVCKEASEGCWQKNRRARFAVTIGKPGS